MRLPDRARHLWKTPSPIRFGSHESRCQTSVQKKAERESTIRKSKLRLTKGAVVLAFRMPENKDEGMWRGAGKDWLNSRCRLLMAAVHVPLPPSSSPLSPPWLKLGRVKGV